MPSVELPENLFGDSVRLKQILINLVKNALKFCLGHYRLVRIIMAYDSSTEMLKVHIVDTGKGIREEDMNKLFQMFGKLKRTAKDNSEGIGMGLMICQNLVHLNKGEISVKSRGADQGSTFMFTMHMQKN